MPGLDGLATLQRLQIAKYKARVIVLTASDDKNDFVQAMKLGTSGIVSKQTATELLISNFPTLADVDVDVKDPVELGAFAVEQRFE